MHGGGANESTDAGFSVTHSAQASGAVAVGVISAPTSLKTQGEGDVVSLSCHSVNSTDSSSNVQYFNGTLTKLLTQLPWRNSVSLYDNIIIRGLILFCSLHWPIWSAMLESVHIGRCPVTQSEKTKLTATWSIEKLYKLFP